MTAVGVDVGGTTIRAGVVDERGTVLDIVQAATPSGEAAADDAVVGVVEQLIRQHDVTAVGLAVAGFVAPDRRTVGYAPHLPWRDVAVADRLAARIGVPVTLEHDANAAAVAEYTHGAARGAGVAVLVAIGTGIGAALLQDGRVFRGAYGVAPELGHLRLVPDGRPCPCGRAGCWERYCSGTALVATAMELLARNPGRSTVLAALAADDPGAVTGRRVMLAARDGDPVAAMAVAELARWLGDGLAVVADIYDPDIIVLGGGVSESAPLFLDDARERYAAGLTGAGHRTLARIRAAELGGDAGIVGAAVLARWELSGRQQDVRG